MGHQLKRLTNRRRLAARPRGCPSVTAGGAALQFSRPHPRALQNEGAFLRSRPLPGPGFTTGIYLSCWGSSADGTAGTAGVAGTPLAPGTAGTAGTAALTLELTC